MDKKKIIELYCEYLEFASNTYNPAWYNKPYFQLLPTIFPLTITDFGFRWLFLKFGYIIHPRNKGLHIRLFDKSLINIYWRRFNCGGHSLTFQFMFLKFHKIREYRPYPQHGFQVTIFKKRYTRHHKSPVN